LETSTLKDEAATAHCDLLITYSVVGNILKRPLIQIKIHEPQLKIEIRHHNLKDCYALYLTAGYKSLLKGAELCHIKKPVKSRFGGGLREFCFEEAQCFAGIEGRNTFLTDTERSFIGDRFSRPRMTITYCYTTMPHLISANLIENALPLHSTEFLKHLQQKWVLSAGKQPVDDIREYFGTEIAMYFSWLGHMTTALWFPALLGLLMYLFGFKYRMTPAKVAQQDTFQLFSDISFVCFAFFNCVWSTAYLESWKRKQAELAFKWGTYDTNYDPYLQDPRPQFRGEFFAPNPVSGRIEPFYPAWKHAIVRYGITYPLTLFFVICMFLTMLVVFQVQDAADYQFGSTFLLSWICYLPMIVYALMIVISDKLYRQLALYLNDLENYRTDDEYEDFLISKIVIFQFVTAFGSLFYIAFYLKDMKRLQETLATLLITRQITQNVMETAVPFLMEKVKLSRLAYKMTK
uniref:Anoctamin n=1 Tax=Heligmosomoides polygyrus TaxID=6339 RepID=A0A8L8K5F2_HELPZ